MRIRTLFSSKAGSGVTRASACNWRQKLEPIYGAGFWSACHGYYTSLYNINVKKLAEVINQ